MSYTVHITKKAEADILDAADYIEFTLRNPYEADQLLDKIDASVNNLSELARRHPVVDEDPILESWGIRYLMAGNYIAFYTVSEENQQVYVIRFLYGKSDWQNILKQTGSHHGDATRK